MFFRGKSCLRLLETSSAFLLSSERGCFVVLLPNQPGVLDTQPLTSPAQLVTTPNRQGTNIAEKLFQTVRMCFKGSECFSDFCCAWQKDTSENSNGLLRGVYPKGGKFSRVAPAVLK